MFLEQLELALNSIINTYLIEYIIDLMREWDYWNPVDEEEQNEQEGEDIVHTKEDYEWEEKMNGDDIIFTDEELASIGVYNN